MRRETGAAAGLAPVGLAAFNLAMGFGRLSADGVSARVGSSTLGRAGALLAAAGLGTALILGSAVGAIVGFAAMGIGLAAVFPLALRAAGYDPSISGPAVAAVSSVGYAGLLTGPPVIGLLAEGAGPGRGARLRVRPARARGGPGRPPLDAHAGRQPDLRFFS